MWMVADAQAVLDAQRAQRLDRAETVPKHWQRVNVVDALLVAKVLLVRVVLGGAGLYEQMIEGFLRYLHCERKDRKVPRVKNHTNAASKRFPIACKQTI